MTFLFPQKHENAKHAQSVTLSVWCDRSLLFFFFLLPFPKGICLWLSFIERIKIRKEKKLWNHEWKLWCVCVVLFIASLPMAGWTAYLSAVLLSRAFQQNTCTKLKQLGSHGVGWLVSKTKTCNKKAPVIQADTDAKRSPCNTAFSYTSSARTNWSQ